MPDFPLAPQLRVLPVLKRRSENAWPRREPPCRRQNVVLPRYARAIPAAPFLTALAISPSDLVTPRIHRCMLSLSSQEATGRAVVPGVPAANAGLLDVLLYCRSNHQLNKSPQLNQYYCKLR